MLKPFFRHQAIQSVLTGLLGLYLGLALRTTRWTLHGRDHVAPHLAGAPTIATFWHERLLLMPALWRMAAPKGAATGGARRMHVLVSRHSDGRLIGDLMRRFGVAAIHGSSARDGQERGGAAGLRQLLKVLAAGDQVVVTPDGPRGPARQAALGVAQLAAVSGVTILPCSAQISRRYVLGTWDRMVLPLPFGRGVIVCLPPIQVERHGAEAALPHIAAMLTEAVDMADRLCR